MGTIRRQGVSGRACRRSRSRDRVWTGLVIVGLLVGSVGCDSETTSNSASATTANSVVSNGDEPGSVAQRYVDAVVSGDVDAQLAEVDPAQHDVVETLNEATADQKTEASGDLVLANVTVDGTEATATFTGTLCVQAGSDRRCVDNDDPDTDDPVFVTHLRNIDGRWFVIFPVPEAESPDSVGTEPAQG